jgi:hypothetical protein
MPASIAALNVGVSVRSSLSCFSILAFSIGSRVAVHALHNVASASRLERITSALDISASTPQAGLGCGSPIRRENCGFFVFDPGSP